MNLPTKGSSAYEREGNRPGAVKHARRLRQEAPTAERWLWRELRALKLGVRRQHEIGSYVVDFAALSARLIIEIDGYHHTTPDGQVRDAIRTAWLNSRGFDVIRFSDKDVIRDVPAMAQHIADLIKSRQVRNAR